ncbi:hypothetical protein HN827_09665, partial [archaeon]|nr:hypothetical protein [archaeon]
MKYNNKKTLTILNYLILLCIGLLVLSGCNKSGNTTNVETEEEKDHLVYLYPVKLEYIQAEEALKYDGKYGFQTNVEQFIIDPIMSIMKFMFNADDGYMFRQKNNLDGFDNQDIRSDKTDSVYDKGEKYRNFDGMTLSDTLILDQDEVKAYTQPYKNWVNFQVQTFFTGGNSKFNSINRELIRGIFTEEQRNKIVGLPQKDMNQIYDILTFEQKEELYNLLTAGEPNIIRYIFEADKEERKKLHPYFGFTRNGAPITPHSVLYYAIPDRFVLSERKPDPNTILEPGEYVFKGGNLYFRPIFYQGEFREGTSNRLNTGVKCINYLEDVKDLIANEYDVLRGTNLEKYGKQEWNKLEDYDENVGPFICPIEEESEIDRERGNGEAAKIYIADYISRHEETERPLSQTYLALKHPRGFRKYLPLSIMIHRYPEIFQFIPSNIVGYFFGQERLETRFKRLEIENYVEGAAIDFLPYLKHLAEKYIFEIDEITEVEGNGNLKIIEKGYSFNLFQELDKIEMGFDAPDSLYFAERYSDKDITGYRRTQKEHNILFVDEELELKVIKNSLLFIHSADGNVPWTIEKTLQQAKLDGAYEMKEIMNFDDIDEDKHFPIFYAANDWNGIIRADFYSFLAAEDEEGNYLEYYNQLYPAGDGAVTSMMKPKLYEQVYDDSKLGYYDYPRNNYDLLVDFVENGRIDFDKPEEYYIEGDTFLKKFMTFKKEGSGLDEKTEWLLFNWDALLHSILLNNNDFSIIFDWFSNKDVRIFTDERNFERPKFPEYQNDGTMVKKPYITEKII